MDEGAVHVIAPSHFWRNSKQSERRLINSYTGILQSETPNVSRAYFEMTTHDFGDGNGQVPAHRHSNGQGWIANTAAVAETAFVGSNVKVFGTAKVEAGAILLGRVRVCGDVTIDGDTKLSGAVTVKNDIDLRRYRGPTPSRPGPSPKTEPSDHIPKIGYILTGIVLLVAAIGIGWLAWKIIGFAWNVVEALFNVRFLWTEIWRWLLGIVAVVVVGFFLHLMDRSD